MNRRQGLGFLAGGIALISGAARAALKTITVPAEKLFPFLKDYYALPATERSTFRMAYFAQSSKIGAEGMQMKLMHKGQSLPLTSGLDGLITPLPTVEALRDKAEAVLSAPEGVNFSIRLELMPMFTPEARMDVGPLKQALAQAAKSVKKAAGMMAMAVPNYDTLLITGVSSGEVVLKNGTRSPLPIKPASTSKKGMVFPATPYFTPAKWPEAVAVQLPEAPHHLLIVPEPKA